jgi:hypothetical protein
VLLVKAATADSLRQICEKLLASGGVAYLGHTDLELVDSRFHKIIIGESAEAYARVLYSALRSLDRLAPEVIVVQGIPETGEGAAVMDRLSRAASQVIES